MKSVAFLLLTLMLVPLALHAQVGSAVITGVIRDQTGSPVPNATVKLSNIESGITSDLVTNESGAYRANSILPGVYDIESSAPGFTSVKQKEVRVSTAQVLAVDLTLQLGASSQTITVEGTSDLAETQSASLAQVVGHQYIDKLPLPNRSANSLVGLSPGVVLLDPGQGAENYPIFSVAGGRERSQNFELDGGSIGNAVGLTRASQVASLPLDALEEFRIISNNYAAEYGHSTGGVVLLTTRSGTNQFHGSIFEYLRNNALDARNFFAATKPPLRLNQFGGALGGPIRKDKTHFFVSWEQTRQASSDTVLSTVPTLAQRGGDFSGISSQIYNPFVTAGGAKQPFAGNRIPVNFLDPVAVATSNYWPLPNRNGGANGANNFGSNSPQVLNRNIIVGKLDQSFSDADRASARYYINDASTENSGSYGIPVADPNATNTDVRIQSFLATYTHTFSPTLLNNFQVSYMQRKFIQTRPGGGDDYAGKLGLTGVSNAAFPTFNVAGYAPLGSQAIANSSIARIQSPIRDTQIQDAISKTAGQHSLKAGLEYRFGYNNESNDLSSSGNFVFSRLITDRPGASNTGDAYASFLLGTANSATLNATDVIPSHAAYWSAYFQDDWRVTSRLTLNLGLRWEIETPRTVEGDKINGFDPYSINPVSGTLGVVTFASQNSVPRTSFDPNYRNFGPRAGFAYSAPFMKGLIVRGGGGFFYGPNLSNSVTTGATLGYSDNVSLVTAQAETNYALRLAGGFPAHPRPAPNTPGLGAVAPGQTPNTAVTFFDRYRPSPVSYQFNLDVQKEVGSNIVLELGYLGNVSHHLSANDLTLDQVPSQFLGAGNAQTKRPFPQFSNVTSLNPNIGNSTYHAVFIKGERRFANGFSFLAHYTFSKFLDDVASGDEFGDPGSYMDQYNRRLDKGRSGSDVPSRMVVTLLYQVPNFHKRRLLDAAAGGWQVGINTNVQSGAVFTVFDSANTTNAFPAGTLRPNLIGNPSLGDASSLSRYFDTSAFQHPASYTFGSAPRSVLRGPHTSTVDLSAAKTFSLTERVRTELRGSLFNALNIANFNIPGHTLGNSDFGIISSAKSARTVQLAFRILF